MSLKLHFFLLDGDLYSGTVADFSASDALIIKDQLRTEQYDFKHLNSEFISNFDRFQLQRLHKIDFTVTSA